MGKLFKYLRYMLLHRLASGSGNSRQDRDWVRFLVSIDKSRLLKRPASIDSFGFWSYEEKIPYINQWLALSKTSTLPIEFQYIWDLSWTFTSTRTNSPFSTWTLLCATHVDNWIRIKDDALLLVSIYLLFYFILVFFFALPSAKSLSTFQVVYVARTSF